MTILKYELESSVKGLADAEEDFWTLCYDTEKEAFYIDHEWDCADPLNSMKQLRSGIRRYSNAAAWRGPGANKLTSGMARLRDRAGRA
jgi:hypothetical protein